MNKIVAIIIMSLFATGAFAGCVGTNEAPGAEEITEEVAEVDFNTITATPPTDATETMAHWHFDEAAAYQFNYDQTGALPEPELEHFMYNIALPEGVVALETLTDWESANMDLDMYLLKMGKDTGICTSNYMVNDPMVIALGDQGTTWEYFNAVANQTKKFRAPADYTIDIEVFNNWEPTAVAGTPTPFTVDIWVYTEVPGGWHPHQELGE